MEPELTESYAYGIVTPTKPPISLPIPLPPPSRIYYPAGEQIDSQNSVTFLGLAQPPQGGGGSTYNRRARAKSGLAGLFVCVDVIYLIVILTVAIPAMLFFLFDVKVKELGELNQINILTYCGSIELARQVEWMGFAASICYFLAVLSLIISVVTLRLTFCYGHVILKIINILVMFCAMALHGYDCHAWMFYFRLGVFSVVHLPIQMLGFKVSIKFIRSILSRPYMIYEPAHMNLPSRRTSGNIRRESSSAITRTHSHRRIATVD